MRRLLAAVTACALLTGCGLPLENGVRSPGPVAGEAQEPGGMQALPDGPAPDASPRDLVQGFLQAQASPEDDHAVARQFLHPDVRDEWDDDRVLVRSAADVTVDPADPTRVLVRTEVVARVSADGSYGIETPADPFEEVYVARPDDTGQLRLASVPDGLLLTPTDTARSFSPLDVWFLRGSGDGDLPLLVPDRVFLPVGADVADALVRRLLAGPSEALLDAVSTAVPPGTELRRPVTSEDGVLTVDLTAPAAAALGAQRRHLSAQLVWTLQGAGQVFTSMRLLVEGQPLQVDGVDTVQDRDAWPQYDPAQRGGTLLLVQDRRLAAVTGGVPASEASDGRLPVDVAVASPASQQLALLTRSESGDVVRTGPPRGPFEVALARGPVGSLSWGSGVDGLWIVEQGSEPQVLLVRPGGGDPLSVSYTRPSGAGQLASLKVSRDGARVAAVFGSGSARQVFVGRVERPTEGATDGIRLAGFAPVAPGLTDVADVAWSSGTSLVVLGALGTANRLPVRVAVDGSELEPVRTLGLDGEPETVAAASDRPLVVGTVLGDRRVLFVEEEGGLFGRPRDGSAPAYPG